MHKKVVLVGGIGDDASMAERPTSGSTARGPSDPSIVIAGGGIAGLYAAYLLGRLGYDVQLFELSEDRWGGRIDSRTFRRDDSPDFIAEFGPMRFEPDLQVRLRRLCFHVSIAFDPFSPTTAPSSTTHYDLTETEQSLRSVADLLKWAVLRMFFAGEIRDELDRIRASGHRGRGRGRDTNVGPRQLVALQRHMDSRLFCDVRRDGDGLRITALPDETIQRNMDTLRARARLRGEGDGIPLAEVGLWNALSEVISPGAIARIRDNGTFYHLIGQNPSALEWGIFWLRQASVMGALSQFSRGTAPEGVFTLVSRLIERIRAECPSVRLSLGHEVVRVEHGKRPDEVVVRVTCHDSRHGTTYSFNQRADHVILALPQQPLRQLNEHFPIDVRARLERVAPLPLLKAFLVKREPWWRHHLKAQTFAWLVPTRELHFFRHDADNCPVPRDALAECACKPGTSSVAIDDGMIMLYTDHPAIAYWQALMTAEQRGRTTWRSSDDRWSALEEVQSDRNGLLATLIRRLLLIPDPGLAERIALKKTDFLKKLRARDAALASRIGTTSTALDLAEKIYLNTEERADQTTVKEAFAAARVDVDVDWRDWLDLAIRYAKVEPELEGAITRLAEDVLAYGIRDWSAPPFGGAAHVWLPLERTLASSSEAPSAETKPSEAGPSEARLPPGDPLIAFSLRGRADDEYVENVHVCGEAYSTFQGFIEGALRTAEQVVASIAGGDPASWVFSMDPASPLEDAWVEKQPACLASYWDELARPQR